MTADLLHSHSDAARRIDGWVRADDSELIDEQQGPAACCEAADTDAGVTATIAEERSYTPQTGLASVDNVLFYVTKRRA